jgi:hypothetical protein
MIMARPRVADGGDILHIWTVVANMLNRQSQRADKGGPPAWAGWGWRGMLNEGLTTPHR